MEKESRKQERMNEILSRDLTDSKSTMTKLKTENANLKEENAKMLTELKKLKADFQHLKQKNGKLNSEKSITPPDSILSDKSKGINIFLNNKYHIIPEDFLPKPPTPPELALRSAKNSPNITEQMINKRKFADNIQRITTPKNESNRQQFEDRLYFSPQTTVNRRSVSPEPKRPALGPPSLLPPQRCAPNLSYHREVAYRVILY